jgi:glycosyltransferase involved in cell wall biosynthesis
MATVGYIPYTETAVSAEARYLGELLAVAVNVASGLPCLNDGPAGLAPRTRLAEAVRGLTGLPAVVAEGPAGFLWAAMLRAHGFAGSVTVLPYLNPRRWYDVAAIALYRRFAEPGDRVFLGSTPSAAIYRALGVAAHVAEPYGIDGCLFAPRAGAAERVRDELSIPPGRVLLFAGRVQPDKDVYRLLRVGLKARVLFPDLQVVIASHVTDHEYLAEARVRLDRDSGVHFVEPTREQLADLYNVADVFVTASTSHFETFGRAPAEALACGTPAVAPRYDGFVEVLAQPGGVLVDVEIDPHTGAPRVNEDLLLRAVYDVLSSKPPARDEIAATAHGRFARSTTIDALRYLTDAVIMPGPPTVVPRVALALPPEWQQPQAEIDTREPLDALSWLLTECDHARFAAHDHAFTLEIRRSLCAPSTT